MATQQAATCSECPKPVPKPRNWTCGDACWKARTERLRVERKKPKPVAPPKPRKWPAVYLELAVQVQAHVPLRLGEWRDREPPCGVGERMVS